MIKVPRKHYLEKLSFERVCKLVLLEQFTDSTNYYMPVKDKIHYPFYGRKNVQDFFIWNVHNVLKKSHLEMHIFKQSGKQLQADHGFQNPKLLKVFRFQMIIFGKKRHRSQKIDTS